MRLRLDWKSATRSKLAHVTGAAAHESITTANETVIIHKSSYLRNNWAILQNILMQIDFEKFNVAQIGKDPLVCSVIVLARLIVTGGGNHMQSHSFNHPFVSRPLANMPR